LPDIAGELAILAIDPTARVVFGFNVWFTKGRETMTLVIFVS
jgi:hypothetical protein